jgi:diphthamide biosynthesis protein 3
VTLISQGFFYSFPARKFDDSSKRIEGPFFFYKFIHFLKWKGNANQSQKMSIYDEIEIEDMTFDPTLQIYHYPCPCGDRFEINIDDLRDGEDIAVCPSCSLMIKVIFEAVSLLFSFPL